MTGRCAHPKVIATIVGAMTIEDRNIIGTRLAEGVRGLDPWHCVVLPSEVQVEFPECSWCRKPQRERRRWWR